MKLKKVISIIILLAILITNIPLVYGATTTHKSSKYFIDLDNHWCSEAVDSLYEYGIIKGKKENKYCPNDTITKAELATLLYRLIPDKDAIAASAKTDSKLEDISTKDWYYESLNCLYNLKIIEVDAFENKVYPSQNISREECFYSIRCFIEVFYQENPKASKTQFSDTKNISSRYVSAINALAALKYINGDDKNAINPKKTLTRAEVAQLIYNIFKAHKDLYNKINEEEPEITDEDKAVEYLNSRISNYEINLLAYVVQGEIGSGYKIEKEAVAWEVLNRLDTTGVSGFGRSLTYILSYPNQYGTYYKTFSYDKVWKDMYGLVYQVCLNWAKEKLGQPNVVRAIPQGYKFHVGDGKHNRFYKTYEDFTRGRNPLCFYWTEDGGYFA